jgi:tetratricopeptide (TPR) repeat protein
VGRDALALVALDQARNCTGPIWLHGRLLRIPVALSLGRLEEARTDLEQTWCQYREREASLFPEAFAMIGRTEQAAAILRLNESSWREGQLATAAPSFGGHYQLGEYDQAFLWLNRAIENREWEILPFLRSTLFYPNIRDDLRFDRAMRRVAEIETIGSPTKSVATQ